MLVTHGDIVRNMDNQNLAEVFCAIIKKAIHKDYLKDRVDNSTKEWYNKNVVKNVKDWLDEPYYELGE
ncbi:MAG: hypothetical protein J6S67_04710 [Methanobrevibacter sp.]|nr:hypothetical protein [Methanobrevibacter sp.]